MDKSAEHVDPAEVRRYGSRPDDSERPGRIGWVQVEGAVRPYPVRAT